LPIKVFRGDRLGELMSEDLSRGELTHLRQVRVFVGSPGDTEGERTALGEVIQRINHAPFARDRRVTLSLMQWQTDAWPGFGLDAQAVINEQIQKYDIFVGIMRHRLGTPTHRAASGSVEEFERAYQLWASHKTPSIMLYFSAEAVPRDQVEDATKVQKFREHVARLGGLIFDFKDTQHFENMVYAHLEQELERLLMPTDAILADDRPPPTKPVLSRQPLPISEVTVDGSGRRGKYRTISDAIQAAPSGARILVSNGVYQDHLAIEKPLEIVAPDGDVTIIGTNFTAVTFDTNMGLIKHFKLKQNGNAEPCVVIKQGRLNMEDCDITSCGDVGIVVSGGADPLLRRNRVYDSERGICVTGGSRGTFADNQVYAIKLSGIEVTNGADPVFRRNSIRECGNSGIYVHGPNTRGLFEDNEIYANDLAGVAVDNVADPTFRRNRIRGGRRQGVYIFGGGKGRLEENQVVANEGDGVAIKGSDSNTILDRNNIRSGRRGGIYITDGAAGTFDSNEISGNALAGIAVAKNADPIVRNNRICDGKREGIYISDGGRGMFENNKILGNALAGVEITGANAEPVFKATEFHPTGIRRYG